MNLKGWLHRHCHTHRSWPLPCASFHPSSRYHPYQSSQICFWTFALSIAPEVTACLPAEWAWCGPPSCPPPRFHHGLINLLVCHAFNFAPFLQVLVKLLVATPLLHFRLHWGPGSQACSCQEFSVLFTAFTVHAGLLETGPAHLNLLPVLRRAQRK